MSMLQFEAGTNFLFLRSTTDWNGFALSNLPLGSLWEKPTLCICLAWGVLLEENEVKEFNIWILRKPVKLSCDILNWTNHSALFSLMFMLLPRSKLVVYKARLPLEALKSNPMKYDANEVHNIVPTCSQHLFSLYNDSLRVFSA